MEDVADKEDFIFIRGELDQFFTIGLIEREGLFDKDVSTHRSQTCIIA